MIKLYGPANDNYLSFPMEGYSLALDFKIEPGLFALLEQLDEIVLTNLCIIIWTSAVMAAKN